LDQFGDPNGEGGKDFNLGYNLGWLYYKYSDYESAFNEFAQLYIGQPYNPVLSYDMANSYFYLKKYDLARVEYDKSIDYYQAMADRVAYINPESERHKEIYGQLSRSYNNRGVVNVMLSRQNPKNSAQYEQQALLDFYHAKDSANKINTIYNFAEYNIKFILNKAIKGRGPALDQDLPKRTSLQKLNDEYKENLIKSL
jgi:tetratricopeptide (TPR) repeat protein